MENILLKKYLEINNLTISEFSKKYKVSKATLYRILKGQKYKYNDKTLEIFGSLNIHLEAIERKKIWYAFYKGDEFICLGSLQECADFLDITLDNARWKTCPSIKNRFKDDGNALLGYRVEDDEEDE